MSVRRPYPVDEAWDGHYPVDEAWNGSYPEDESGTVVML